jgi:tyrosinase
VHDGPVLVAPDGLSTLPIPAGVGGGFVKTGPFANMSVNLGPVGGLNGTAPGPDGGLGYNPRGLKRDVGPAVNMRYANYSTVLSEYSFRDATRFEQHTNHSLLLRPSVEA